MPLECSLQAAGEDTDATPKSNKKDSKNSSQESNASSSDDGHTRATQHLSLVIPSPALPFLQDEEQDSSTVHVASVREVEVPAPVLRSAERVEQPEPTRVRKKKAPVSLTDATPLPAPEKPAEDEPWTPLVCLKLADYYRGETLPESERKESPYQKAVQAAIRLVNKQRATYQQVDAVFRYMKGIDESLRDDWWVDKKVDLWHVAEHCTVKLREIERKTKKTHLMAGSSSPSSPVRPCVLVSEEKRQRNLERLRALAAAKPSQEREVATAR